MKKLKTLRMDTELIEIINAKAEEENRSFSNMVVCILEQWRDSKKQKSA